LGKSSDKGARARERSDSDAGSSKDSDKGVARGKKNHTQTPVRVNRLTKALGREKDHTQTRDRVENLKKALAQGTDLINGTRSSDDSRKGVGGNDLTQTQAQITILTHELKQVKYPAQASTKV